MKIEQFDIWNDEYINNENQDEIDFEKLENRFYELFNYDVSLDNFNLDIEEINEILKRSIDDKIDYLKDFIITEKSDEQVMYELISEVMKGLNTSYDENMKKFLIKLYSNKELEKNNSDDAFSILNYIYKTIQKIEKDSAVNILNHEECWADNLELNCIIELPKADILIMAINDYWEPEELKQLRCEREQVLLCAIKKYKKENIDVKINRKEIIDKIDSLYKIIEVTYFRYRRRKQILEDFIKIRENIIKDINYISNDMDDADLSDELFEAVHGISNFNAESNEYKYESFLGKKICEQSLDEGE